MSEDKRDTGNNVIKRIPFYSDDMMINYINNMLAVVTKTTDMKIGRGKKSEIKKVLVYDDTEVIDKLKNSLEYYTQCNLENTKKK